MKDFHHYKGGKLNRYEKVEREVIELILTSNVADEKRDDSKTFAFMHASGCMQIAKVLAQKRRLDVNIASVATILHDIAVAVNGTYKDHAKLGGPIAQKILQRIGGFTKEEAEIITQAVFHHSEKEIYTHDPYIELVKDADVFDCSLYVNSEGYYRIHKPKHIFKEYVKRIKAVRKELNLPKEPIFRT